MKKDKDGVLTAESIKQIFADFAGITDLTDAEIAIVQGTSKDASYKQGYEIGSIIAAHANVGAISSAIRAQGGNHRNGEAHFRWFFFLKLRPGQATNRHLTKLHRKPIFESVIVRHLSKYLKESW